LLQPPLFGQEKELDSLHHALASLKDTARIDAIVPIFVYYMHHNNYDSAMYYARLRTEESQKLNYIHGIATSHTANAAMQLRIYRNFPAAEKEAKEALKWFEKTNNKKDIEIAYWHAGAAIFFQYNYDDATPYLDSSYSWSEKHKNAVWMFNVLGFKYENYRILEIMKRLLMHFKKTSSSSWP
jgi:hypothetical protein